MSCNVYTITSQPFGQALYTQKVNVYAQLHWLEMELIAFG